MSQMVFKMSYEETGPMPNPSSNFNDNQDTVYLTLDTSKLYIFRFENLNNVKLPQNTYDIKFTQYFPSSSYVKDESGFIRDKMLSTGRLQFTYNQCGNYIVSVFYNGIEQTVVNKYLNICTVNTIFLMSNQYNEIPYELTFYNNLSNFDIDEYQCTYYNDFTFNDIVFYAQNTDNSNKVNFEINSNINGTITILFKNTNINYTIFNNVIQILKNETNVD
jgi:hypothetical protein